MKAYCELKDTWECKYSGKRLVNPWLVDGLAPYCKKAKQLLKRIKACPLDEEHGVFKILEAKKRLAEGAKKSMEVLEQNKCNVAFTGDFDGHEVNVTHWKPLPEPPEVKNV